MKRFVKVALLLAAFSVLACGAAFAAYPLENLPGDLAAPTDVHLVSEDALAAGAIGNLLVSQDKTAAHKLLDFVVSHDTDGLKVINAFGVFSHDNGAYHALSEAFDKLVVRTTAKTFGMNFAVTSLDPAWVAPTTIGLWSGFETVAPKGPMGVELAKNCTLACTNFFHEMQHSDPLKADATFSPVTLRDTVTWTGTGEAEYYVECCDHLGLVVSQNALVTRTVGSLDMVVAHLSETPFVRVQTVDAYKVAATPFGVYDGVASKDFRDWRGSKVYNAEPVDVPEGQTYNLGVHYTVSGDCNYCGTTHCVDKNGVLPLISVSNLGTAGVFIGDNYETNKKIDIAPWLCNSWCGLCEFDDMMSGDKGSLGVYFSKAAAARTEADIKSQSALWDCVCHIYPAFTNSFKAAGNVDINWKGYKTVDAAKVSDVVTTIAGRVNTSWNGFSLSSGGLCDTCKNDAWIFEPCDCLPIVYRNALGVDSLLFAKHGELKLNSFDEKKGDDYAGLSAELQASVSRDIMLTKLTWTVPGTALEDAGLVNDASWWRSDIWNKLAIKVNGVVLNAANVESVGVDALDADELAFLTIVNGPRTQKLAKTDKIDVSLFLFVVDGCAKGGDKPEVKYYKASNGNRFLVYFDGVKDDKFTYSASIAKADAPVPAEFAVSPATLALNMADKTTGTITATGATGTVAWTTNQGENGIISLDVAADTYAVKVTALKASDSNVVVTATDSGTAKSADCVVSVTEKPVSPDQPGDGGSSGCSVGFAPAALLLLAPLFFLKK